MTLHTNWNTVLLNRSKTWILHSLNSFLQVWRQIRHKLWKFRERSDVLLISSMYYFIRHVIEGIVHLGDIQLISIFIQYWVAWWNQMPNLLAVELWSLLWSWITVIESSISESASEAWISIRIWVNWSSVVSSESVSLWLGLISWCEVVSHLHEEKEWIYSII